MAASLVVWDEFDRGAIPLCFGLRSMLIPAMISLSVAQSSIESERIKQEIADKIILEAYSAYPGLFYDYAE
jgi:Tfp pilus assembly protein PilX